MTILTTFAFSNMFAKGLDVNVVPEVVHRDFRMFIYLHELSYKIHGVPL